MLLGDGASTALVRRMVEIGTRDVLRKNVSPEEGRTVPAEVAAHHLVVSSLALIRWWLENGMSYSPGRMGEIYHAPHRTSYPRRGVRHTALVAGPDPAAAPVKFTNASRSGSMYRNQKLHVFY